jgi:APA family basic amino acid/polyamine antiporter
VANAGLMVILLFEKPVYTWPGLLIVASGVPVFYLWRRALGTGLDHA